MVPLCGTPYYIAPEVILKEGYGRPVDWWSMGIILHKFLTGSVPFDGDSVAELYDRIVIGDIIWDCNSAPTPNAQNLITELLRTNPADRLGTGGSLEIKSHPFLSDLDFNNLLSQKPEYIPQLASDVDNSLFIDHSEIDHSVSEDEEGTSVNNENLDFQNFTSSSERLSKLCTITTRKMNDEDQKSPPECTPATNTNISEIMEELEVTSWVFWSDPLILPDRQKESFSESDSDNAINSLSSSSPSSVLSPDVCYFSELVIFLSVIITSAFEPLFIF
ncbi:microtubule-associated serine/threonine-protein kinase 3-like [Phyllobates terribilis]|uniref:microtubule-associated serine/threonine-protein kinase 3-like n=1 Tax=Phyllobates terribilis TaxID=111132 RepID=UPI003CCB17B4